MKKKYKYPLLILILVIIIIIGLIVFKMFFTKSEAKNNVYFRWKRYYFNERYLQRIKKGFKRKRY